MVGIIGVVFVGVIWQGIGAAWWLLSTVWTLLRMLYWAIWCGSGDRGGLCRHPWVIWMRERLGFVVPPGPLPPKPKGLSVAEDVAWRRAVLEERKRHAKH